MRPLALLGVAAIALVGLAVAGAQAPPASPLTYPPTPQITKDGTSVVVADYASLPLSGLRLSPWVDKPYPPPPDLHGQLGRVNGLRSEPPDAPLSATRLFVVDQNGTLYTLDKTTKTFTPYLDFGRIFGKFNTDPYVTNGIASLAFDPAYARNGKFYTVHTENPGIAGQAAATNAYLTALNVSGLSTTAAVKPPVGDVLIESVVEEWTDTNIRNSTFEGTVREILRVGYDDSRHPMYDLLFNPLAGPGDPDYGNLYVSLGDGGTGERAGPTHTIPQRLDALPGKILRITPDLALRPTDALGANGRYRIPSTGSDPNPFVSTGGARGEIYAYGFRSPIRMTWDRATDTLIANDIGLSSWEEVDVVSKGANYGWAEREGPEQIWEVVGRGDRNGRTGSQLSPPTPFPSPDTLNVEGVKDPVTPVYPAAVFSHRESNGAAIGGGFVYRGTLMPALTGKYIFSEVVSGRIFYADLADMLRAHGVRGQQAAVHEVQILYKGPDAGATGGPVARRMYDIVKEAFTRKGGIATAPCVMPDGTSRQGVVTTCGPRGRGADPYGVEYGNGGRADVRLGMDGDGELYLLSKTDGMIRKLVSVVTPLPPSTAR